MKKFFAIVMALVMVTSICAVSASAANSNFVGSVVNTGVPTVVSATADGSSANVSVTSYANRGSIADGGAQMEAGYNALNANTMSGLGLGNCKVLAIFDLACNQSFGNATVTLKFAGLQNFVSLLHFENGVWVKVDGASVSNDELTFSVSSMSPFAIVVNAVSAPASAQTGESANLGALVGAALLFVAAGVFFVKGKKVNA